MRYGLLRRRIGRLPKAVVGGPLCVEGYASIRVSQRGVECVNERAEEVRTTAVAGPSSASPLLFAAARSPRASCRGRNLGDRLG